MKKMFLVMMAGMLAIGFSAFTSISKPSTIYYYKTPTGFATFTGTPCPEDDDEICMRPLASGGNPVVVLKSENENDPLKYDPE